MRKWSLTIAIATLIGFSSLANAAENRYYFGIGIQLRQIGNGYDELSGLIVIDDILPGSPAQIAGLSKSDYIIEVNGQSVKNLKLEEIVKMIKSDSEVSKSLRLKFGLRKETKFVEIHEVELQRVKIDRAAWILREGNELKDQISSGNTVVSYHSRVTENKQKETFIYQYRIKNEGKSEVFVRWQLLDRAFPEQPEEMNIIALKLGESKEITLETSDLPVSIYGSMRIFEKIGNGYSEKQSYVEVTKGFIPENMLKKSEEK